MITIPEGSRCKDRAAILCNYIVDAVYPDAHIEFCKNCGKKVIYNKDVKTGRIDNAKYLQDHFRDFLQPRGEMLELYKLIYGSKKIEARIEENRHKKYNPTIQDIKEESSDMLETMKRKSVNF